MSGNLPFISCKCITYGRVETLEESIESFLKQDYPADKCELVIVNDYPKQTLKFDHPQIKVYNINQTFTSIGAKENFATELCKGDIICQWDDDDVALSNHLLNISKYFKEDSNLLHWERGVFYNEPKITSIQAIGNSGIVYKKSAWEKIGKYPLENAGYDMSFITAIHELGRDKVVLAAPKDEECSWFYMWGGRGYPQSGMGTDDGTRPNVIQRHTLFIERERLAGKIPTGDVILKPHWNRNYAQMLKDFTKCS